MHGEGIAYLPTVWLASCRIRLNCFFILYLSALTPTGGNIPHYFSQYNGPCSAAAQHKIPTVAFPFPHRKLPAPIQNLFHDRTKLILLLMINVFPPPPPPSTFAPSPAQGCWTSSPRALARRERRQRPGASRLRSSAIWEM